MFGKWDEAIPKDLDVYELVLMLPGVSPDQVRTWSLEDRNNIRLVQAAKVEALPLIEQQEKKRKEDEQYRKGGLS